MTEIAGLDFFIETQKYQSQIHFLDNELVLTKRQHHFERHHKITETYGSQWLLMILQESTADASVESRSQTLPLTKNSAVFLPPHSIVTWNVSPGSIHWIALNSWIPLSGFSTSTPLIFPWTQRLPDNSESVVQCLLQAKSKFVAIEPKVSALAFRAKKLIDQRFDSGCTITEIAKELGVTRSHLTRSFKNCFRLHPTDYRIRLMLFQSLKFLGTEMNVTQVAAEVGFSSVNQYTTHFKNQFGLSPSECNPLKMGYRLNRTVPV